MGEAVFTDKDNQKVDTYNSTTTCIITRVAFKIYSSLRGYISTSYISPISPILIPLLVIETEIGSTEISYRGKMMNVLALSLVMTTLVTAVVFSPSPQKHNPREDDVILKEGHRVVVVEYEKNDKNTKVSISPQEIDEKPTNLKDNLSENMEDAKEEKNEEGIHHGFSPRELVCDAYGKCKHKIVSAIGKTKDTLSDQAAETAHLARDKAAEKVHEGADKAAEKVHEVEEEAKEAIGNLKDRVTHKSREAKEHVKDTVYEKASEVRRATEKAKRGGAETAKNLQGEIERNGSRIMDGTKEKIADSAKKAGEIVESASEKVKDSAQRVKDEGEKGLNQFLRRVTGVLGLLGLATAYGMCMWVTFVSSFVLAGALPRQQFAMVQSKIYPVYLKAMTYSVGLALLGHVLSRTKRSSSVRQEILQGFNLGAPLLMILVEFFYLEPRSSKVVLERMKKEKEEGRGKEGFTTEPSSQVMDALTDRAATSTGKEGLVMEQLSGVTDRAATGTHGERSTDASSRQDAAQDRTEKAAGKAQLLRLTGILKGLNQYSSLLNVLTLMSLTWHLVNLGQHLNSV
ncbi:unnamed protein product [Fraxinus pennsylvanica]|uniref:TMEM205-like domain-containing protein n=1 Tax=Fraxinus pennsylvanica TaxID=56036 RepID=A0AAD1YU67_9LAMI|nr:unnamed protein product [Fraxinus pennsylvanica]